MGLPGMPDALSKQAVRDRIKELMTDIETARRAQQGQDEHPPLVAAAVAPAGKHLAAVMQRKILISLLL